MDQIKDDELIDEQFGLLMKGLYVEPLNYKMDPTKIPENGHEYIHLVRMEESLTPALNEDSFKNYPVCDSRQSSNSSDISLNEWKRTEANFFSQLAAQLKFKREKLNEKYAKMKTPPLKNEEDWCCFVLGSDSCKQIYGNNSLKQCLKNPPYLSFLLPLSQEEICVLLESIKKWFSIIGMTDDLCMWIYCLLACLAKPVSENCEEILETFLEELVDRSKKCDNLEKKQLHLIIAILKMYFCVELYPVSSTLNFGRWL